MKRLLALIVLVMMTSMAVSTGFAAPEDPGTIRTMGCSAGQAGDPDLCWQ